MIKNKKCMGIWMDHSIAHLMEWNDKAIETTVIHSAFTHEDKVHSMNKSENLMHNKENQLLHAYFTQLGEIIKGYQHVVLFGPTSAKTELVHFLKRDTHFDQVIIEEVDADKMTENQQHAFVRDYFPEHSRKMQTSDF